MAHFDKLLKSKQKQELLARLTAPQHIVQNQFTEHQMIEGYFQNRSAADFCGCDRLMKIDTLYGTGECGSCGYFRQEACFSVFGICMSDARRRFP